MVRFIDIILPQKLKKNDIAFLLGDLNCNALFKGYPDHIVKDFF